MRSLLIVLLLIFFSCKKEKKIDPVNYSSTAATANPPLRGKFIDTLVSNLSSYQPLHVSFCHSSSYFYVLQKQSAGNYLLLKCDREINLVFQKQISIGTETLIDFCASKKEDACFILTSTYNFSMNGNPVQGYFKFSDYTDSLNGCTPGFQQTDFDYSETISAEGEISVGNYSKLIKLDEDGDEEWHKTIDGNNFNGNAIETDINGFVYVLTASRGGYEPLLVSQFSGGLAPYYNLEKSNNNFTVRKYDGNGNLFFTRVESGVFESLAGEFNPSLSLSSQRIHVFNENNLFTFDLNGTLVSEDKPVSNTCYNYISNVAAHPLGANALCKGYLQISNNPAARSHYRYELKSGTNFTSDNRTPLMMDAQGNTYSFYQPVLTKFNSNGAVVYSKSLFYAPVNNFLLGNNTAFNDQNQLYLFMIDAAGSRILAFKFDNSGSFN